MNEARNTFNAIAGKPQVVTRFWCRLGIHRWQKWSDVKDVKKAGFDTLYDRIQDRYCDGCNKYQRKKLLI